MFVLLIKTFVLLIKDVCIIDKKHQVKFQIHLLNPSHDMAIAIFVDWKRTLMKTVKNADRKNAKYILNITKIIFLNNNLQYTLKK